MKVGTKLTVATSTGVDRVAGLVVEWGGVHDHWSVCLSVSYHLVCYWFFFTFSNVVS